MRVAADHVGKEAVADQGAGRLDVEAAAAVAYVEDDSPLARLARCRPNLSPLVAETVPVTRVAMRDDVSGPEQRKAEYEALLKEAASFDVDQPKARKNRLTNILSQRRAAYLLKHEDDVFPD